MFVGNKEELDMKVALTTDRQSITLRVDMIQDWLAAGESSQRAW